MLVFFVDGNGGVFDIFHVNDDFVDLLFVCGGAAAVELDLLCIFLSTFDRG